MRLKERSALYLRKYNVNFAFLVSALAAIRTECTFLPFANSSNGKVPPFCVRSLKFTTCT